MSLSWFKSELYKYKIDYYPIQIKVGVYKK